VASFDQLEPVGLHVYLSVSLIRTICTPSASKRISLMEVGAISNLSMIWAGLK
jgi:hypothetical protein